MARIVHLIQEAFHSLLCDCFLLNKAVLSHVNSMRLLLLAESLVLDLKVMSNVLELLLHVLERSFIITYGNTSVYR